MYMYTLIQIAAFQQGELLTAKTNFLWLSIHPVSQIPISTLSGASFCQQKSTQIHLGKDAWLAFFFFSNLHLNLCFLQKSWGRGTAITWDEPKSPGNRNIDTNNSWRLVGLQERERVEREGIILINLSLYCMVKVPVPKDCQCKCRGNKSQRRRNHLLEDMLSTSVAELGAPASKSPKLLAEAQFCCQFF